MKMETKELKKVIDLLLKEGVSLLQVCESVHNTHLIFKFTDASGMDVVVDVFDADSQTFSKITRQQRF
jgi:hypothetical protein